MTDVRTYQAGVRSVNLNSPDLNVNQASVRTVFNFPSDSTEVYQSSIRTVKDNSVDLRNYLSVIRAVYRGRSSDPQVRAWTFTLDGHDYYVLRLGTTETLIYDLHTNLWYTWGSGSEPLWRAYIGTNWLAGNFLAPNFGSNVIVGDDGNGSIYFLDPYGDLDDDPIDGVSSPREFRRTVSFQVPTKSYKSVRCFGIELLGSIGQNSADLTTDSVQLSYSDDRGTSYVDAGSLSMTPEDYSARLYWGSLGSISAPGRIFQVTDYGALKRLDSAMMVVDGEGFV